MIIRGRSKSMLDYIDPEHEEYIKGYAQALQDLLRLLTGENNISKSYDPVSIDNARGIIKSYAFDLKTGGRTHPYNDFESISDLLSTMAKEVANEIASLAYHGE